MTISYKWLKDYVDFDYDIETLKNKISMQGLEVERINKYGGFIDNIVIGQVVDIKKHPNADKLSVCQVNTGKSVQQIVCGASNVWDKKNPKVIVALEGCYLRSKDITIKKTKIRGEESNGMIVSEEELGLAEKSDGIWLLPDSAVVGEYPKDFIPEEDYIIEVSPTANRGDVLGLIGFAREIAAMKGLKVNYPTPNIKTNSSIEKPNITIEDKDLCYRFTSRVIKGIKMTETPKWIKDRLKKMGQRSINVIVDISNYIMFETGQPNHIYDLNKLGNKQIIVRRAKEGEIIKTLDNTERKLTTEMLVIADNKNPVGVAGVMGSESSEVSTNTIDVLLEAAYFYPISIRRTAKRLGLSTDASYRFERIADINITKLTIDRLAQLITEICGGEVSEMVDVYPTVIEPVKMDFKIPYLEKMTGYPIPKNDAKKILESLEFEIKDKDNDTLSLTVPTFKTDVLRPIDVVEEVARVYGYNNIPDTIFPISMNPDILNTRIFLKDRIRDLLVGFGLFEVMNYSFTLSKDVEIMKFPVDNALKILNPFSQDQELLRQSLVPNLIQNAIFNASRGNRSLQAFEIGDIFEKSNKTELGSIERNMLGIILYGNMEEKGLYSSIRKVDFYDMKGIIQLLFENIGITEVEYIRSTEDLLHLSKGADIMVNGTKLGYMGELNPSIAKSYKITQPLIICEITIEELERVKVGERVFKEISKYPAVYRDANFEVRNDVTHELIAKTIRDTGGVILDYFNLVDIYIDDKLKIDNKKSMTYEFIFQDRSRTLEDKEVEDVFQKIIKNVNKVTGGTLRGA